MSYQPQCHSYTPMRPAHHWLALLLKCGGLLVAVAVAATMGAHLIHEYSPPSRTAPVAQIVRYYSQGIGHAGESSHWTMEASEGTREWRRAVRYCQAGHGVPGCATIQTLAQSGY